MGSIRISLANRKPEDTQVEPTDAAATEGAEPVGEPKPRIRVRLSAKSAGGSSKREEPEEVKVEEVEELKTEELAEEVAEEVVAVLGGRMEDVHETKEAVDAVMGDHLFTKHEEEDLPPVPMDTAVATQPEETSPRPEVPLEFKLEEAEEALPEDLAMGLEPSPPRSPPMMEPPSPPKPREWAHMMATPQSREYGSQLPVPDWSEWSCTDVPDINTLLARLTLEKRPVPADVEALYDAPPRKRRRLELEVPVLAGFDLLRTRLSADVLQQAKMKTSFFLTPSERPAPATESCAPLEPLADEHPSAPAEVENDGLACLPPVTTTTVEIEDDDGDDILDDLIGHHSHLDSSLDPMGFDELGLDPLDSLGGLGGDDDIFDDILGDLGGDDIGLVDSVVEDITDPPDADGAAEAQDNLDSFLFGNEEDPLGMEEVVVHSQPVPQGPNLAEREASWMQFQAALMAPSEDLPLGCSRPPSIRCEDVGAVSRFWLRFLDLPPKPRMHVAHAMCATGPADSGSAERGAEEVGVTTRYFADEKLKEGLLMGLSIPETEAALLLLDLLEAERTHQSTKPVKAGQVASCIQALQGSSLFHRLPKSCGLETSDGLRSLRRLLHDPSKLFQEAVLSSFLAHDFLAPTALRRATSATDLYLIKGNPRVYKRSDLFAKKSPPDEEVELMFPLPWAESSWMNVGMDELAARRHPYPSSHNSLSTLRGPESMKQGQQTLGLTSMLVGVQGRVSGNETVAILVWSKLFSQSLAVRHAEVAMKLRGTWPRLGVVQCGRFHRPDFRSGLPEALKKTYSDMKARLPTEPAVAPLAECDRTEGPWDVRATEQCLVGHDMGTLSPGHLESDSSWGLLGPVGLAKTRGAGGGAANRLHPADFFESLKDLTCADAGPLAVIEHVEETPIVMPNLGMSVRIAQLYKPKGSMSDSQAEAKLRGRLGPFGSLHVLKEQDVPVGIPFLDSILKIKPNQGITMLVSPVNRVPLYYHPFKSTTFPSVSRAQATYKSGRFHDSRTTDFLLVRRNAENGGCKVYLRPLKASEKFGIAALYVAGQHHPVVRVPAPSSRKLVDYRREWLKSFVLRLAADGHSDLVYTRGVVHKVFGGLLEQALIQKILTSLKDSGSASVTANQWTTGGGQVRQVEERVIREIFSPETVCVIDSVSRGQWRLHQQGITQLSSHSKKVSRAVLDLDHEEKAGLAAQETHALKWAELVGRTRKQMLGMAVTEEDRLRVEQQVAEWGRIGSSFFEDPTMGRQRVANRGSKLSTVARYVEEELLLTPWNLSASIAEVCNTPSLRFAISGLGDPSGGRGEGLSLLRPGYMNKGDGDFSQTPLLREGEDLRKLNIKELTARLVKVGIDPLTLSRLGRWEQVALIRRCATEGAAALEGLQTDGAKMSMKDTKNQYLESVNRVFVKQRAALQADEPAMTSDEEAADEEAVVDQLEFDLLEGVTDEKVAPITASQERADWEEYKDIYASSREERHERINQRAPLARLKWMRRRRNPLTGSFQGADEKIVYIYGENNIQKFLAWRERRVPAKRARTSRPLRRLPTSTTAAAMATLEASKATARNCQSCGAPGHASSSSLCPKHPHNKANKAAKQAPRAPNTAFMKSSVLNAQFTPQAEHPVTAPAEWNDHVDSPTAVVGMLVTSDDAKAQIDRRGRRMKNPKKEEPASKMPARLTARQHRKLVESNVDGPKERFQGSVEGAVQELNQLLHRIVLNTKKSDRNFQLFWTEVDSRTAPNYYEIVKTPMYLALMVDKCKSRSYRSKHEFMADVNLIKGNCYLYNPEHHWIRPIVDRLEKFLGDQVNTSTVAYQINLVEEFLDDHKD